MSSSSSQFFGLFGVDNEEKGDESKSSNVVERNKNLKLSKICCICDSDHTKYCCPACGLKTCSLTCCKEHKEKFDCDGIKNKATYIALKDFDQTQFISDYMFLENAEKAVDVSHRSLRNIAMSTNSILPRWLQKLRLEARQRGILLKILPAGFQKRKLNTSCFMYQEKEIRWDIELNFSSALRRNTESNINENFSLVIHRKRVSENTILREFLKEYIEPSSLLMDAQLTQQLKIYQREGFKGVTVLIKQEHRGASQYIELDIDKPIIDNLVNLTIIEFPQLYIVLNEHRSSYNLNRT